MDKLHVSRGPGYHHYPCADLDGVRGSQDTQQSKITEPGLGPPPPPFLPGKQNLSCRRGGGSEFFFWIRTFYQTPTEIYRARATKSSPIMN